MGALAVDIGGTKILAGLVAPDGAASATRQVPTPAQEGPDAIIAAVLGLWRGILAEAPAGISACGVGTGGVVGRDGSIASATDLIKDWAGTPLGERLQAELGLPVTVLNDVHATGFCEARIGSAAGAASALVVAVGTGVGGSLVLDGKLVPGRNGIAGSVGHAPSPLRQGRRCSCGALDHVEAYASGPAMEAEYARRTGKVMDLRWIAALAPGDEVARAVIVEGAAALGTAIAGANNVADVEIVAIGGGVAGLGEAFLEPLRGAYRADALGPGKETPIVAAQHGHLACLIGAGLAAQQDTTPRR